MDETTTISPETEPVELSPMSESEGERAIANLLDGNLAKPDPAQSREAPASTEVVEDDELTGLAIESDEEGEEPEGQQAPAPAIGDDFMVTLSDGKQISLGDLKRNNLFQSDYSRKTEELKAERERVQQETRQWRETEEQALIAKRNAVIALARHILPQEPNPEMLDQSSPNYDPVGYMTEEANYKRRMADLNGVLSQQQAEEQAMKEQMKAAEAESFRAEQADLYNRLPKLKDDTKRTAFLTEAQTMLKSVYGLEPAEIGQIRRSAYMHILHDAIQFQKLKAKSATVVKDLPSAPKLTGRQRSAPQTDMARDAEGRFQALRKTGSVEAADKAIEAFLLRSKG
jgi:hypothetical protein